MALAIATVCDSISKLSVSGVTIKDLNEIPETVGTLGHVIFPRPDGFISEVVATRDSQGGSGALWTVTYKLTYRLCYAPIASGRGLFDVYDDMVAKAFLFLDAVLAIDNLSGSVDAVVSDALNFGPVADPAGNMYHGCDIAIMITEFVN